MILFEMYKIHIMRHIIILSDTLSLIARSVGKDVFMPISHECIKYGMHLMDENDDPDIRRAW